MALNTTILTKITANQAGSNDLGTPKFSVNYSDSVSLSDGTGSGQADLLFTDERTIAASASEDLDLAAGLTDALGNTLTFATVKAIMIKASEDNTNDVTVSPAAANGFLGPFADPSDLVSIPPGGSLLVQAPVAGWDVTADTGDLLTIANSSSGTGVTYDIIIVGASA